MLTVLNKETLQEAVHFVMNSNVSSLSCPAFCFTVTCTERFQGKKGLFCSLILTLQLLQARALFSHFIKAQIHNFFLM